MTAAETVVNVRRVLEAQQAEGYAAGMVALVSVGDDAEAAWTGRTALSGGSPAARDTLFRIASMTKPVTAVAAMMLVEEGKLALDEPVDRLLPELANRRVLRRIDGPLDETEPAARPVTVEDLLTFRLGIGLVFGPGDWPIRKATAGLAGFGPPDPSSALGPDAWMRRLGELPLMAQPGEQWLYTAGSNVLGVLIARASGMSLPAFFERRIFGPLGMRDTAFHAPAAKVGRLAVAYRREAGELLVHDQAAGGAWSRPPAFPAGDSGLVSTVDDFNAFSRMLLKGGVAGGAAADLGSLRGRHDPRPPEGRTAPGRPGYPRRRTRMGLWRGGSGRRESGRRAGRRLWLERRLRHKLDCRPGF